MNENHCQSDEKRLATLRATDLLDSPSEEAFDRLTRLASRLLGVPVSLISLVDADRQFFKSSIGLPDQLDVGRETPLSHSFCKHVVESGEMLMVNDARQHQVLKHNLAVPLGVIAYLGFPLVAADGSVLGSFCAIDTQSREWTVDQIETLRDLTASAMTEIELRRVNAELHRANIGKDRFVAMLSHDLRTPLSPALLTAAELIGDPSLPEKVREDLQLIYRNIELEVRMIDSLFDLTRIISGKLIVNKERTDLASVLRTSINICKCDAAGKEIELKLECPPELPPIDADVAKLSQVICNLVKNSIKFSEHGSVVALRAFESKPGMVCFEVRDHGIGIAPSALPRIFDAFEQGEHSVTQRFGGLGLGLAICKGIVQAHDGSIQAASPGTDMGATMTVALPASVSSQSAAAPEVAALPASSRPMSILLVEDHEDSLRAMSRLLRRMTHRVVAANCIAGALKAAAGEEFDLLISDVGLPDGSGLELMEKLTQTRPIKGIALTGYGTESDVKKSRAAGFYQHLTKPINLTDLENAIARVNPDRDL